MKMPEGISGPELEKRFDLYRSASHLTKKAFDEIVAEGQQSRRRNWEVEGIKKRETLEAIIALLEVPYEVFVGDIDEYEEYLRSQPFLTWQRIMASDKCTIADKKLIEFISQRADLFTLEGPQRSNAKVLRGMATVEGPADFDGEVHRLVLGNKHMITIRFTELLDDVSFEIENDQDHFENLNLYVLQTEARLCQLVFPNRSVSSDDLSDVRFERRLDDYSRKFEVQIPGRKKNAWMDLGEYPETGSFCVLIFRNKLGKKLREKLTSPGGCSSEVLDDLAFELAPFLHEKPRDRNFWHIFRAPYQLIM